MDQRQSPPQSTVMQMMMAAWAAQTISTVARLGVADALHDHGPLTAGELIERHRVDARPDMLERALRACASVGVFTEAADGRFGPTPLSGVLVDGAPVDRSASSSSSSAGAGGRCSAGPRRDGADRGAANAFRPTPDTGPTERFGKAMKSRVESTRGAVEHSDLSCARMVVDVGDGFGHLAIALLERYPHLRACVLDLPEVIEVAERHAAAVDERVRAHAVVRRGRTTNAADTYVVKTVMHDWDDASCVRMLRNCRARLAEGGRILGVHNVLPPMGQHGRLRHQAPRHADDAQPPRQGAHRS